jgi:hypothetical protein
MKKIFILAAIMTLAVAGYQVPEPWVGMHYSHTLHLVDAGLTCTDCHFTEGKATFSKEACANCHEDELDAAFLVFGSNMGAARAKVGYQPHPEFDHQKHLDRGAVCEQCHGDMAKVTVGSPANWPKHEQCWTCHDNNKTASNCELCHSDIEKRKPSNHSTIFKHTHGKLAGSVNGKDCLACHKGSSSCAECHRGDNFSNVSHPADFIYTHPFDAKRAQYDCQKCHDTGSFCAECHAAMQVKPETHNESFLWSHKNFFREDPSACAICHSQTEPVCLKCHSIANP